MIRVFVGCAANHEDAESQAVLEYSLRRHASRPLEVTWMRLSKDPASPFHSQGRAGWQTRLWATPFSGFRWAVPELCGFEGRAVYMDSDVIVMADIAELWDQALPPGAAVLAQGGGSWRYCVSLWDCAAARAAVLPLAELRARPGSHREMIARMKARPEWTAPFAGEWNCLEGGKGALTDPAVKAIHYSNMREQPHLPLATKRLAARGRRHWFEGRTRPHRRADLRALFARLLGEAAAAGYPPARYETAPLFGPYQKARAA